MQSDGIMSWPDPAVQEGEAFEYKIERRTSSGGVKATGYLYAGIDVPLMDDRGTLLLVVDERITTPLASEIATLKQDLIGDGWEVVQIVADPDPSAAPGEPIVEDTRQAVSDVKQAIKAAYDAEPQNVKAVFILGNVPVPYSGMYDDVGTPDGHERRSFASDTYYGDVDTEFFDPDPNDPDFLITMGWTDEQTLDPFVINPSSGPGQDNGRGSISNVPGDGRFDNEFVHDDGSGPDVELMVGRVDLSRMDDEFYDDFEPAFDLPSEAFDLEVALLRRYLQKEHLYRHGDMNAPPTGVVVQGGGNMSPTTAQLRNYTALVGHQNVSRNENRDGEHWLDNEEIGALFASASSDAPNHRGINTGSGNDKSVFGFEVATGTTQTVFHSFSGSYMLDWNKDGNLMRSVLGNDGVGLTSQWNPPQSQYDLLLQHMALGETTGFANQVSQEGFEHNRTVWTWRDLLGDPTLRMHVVKPLPSVPQANSNGNGVTISWTPAVGDGANGGSDPDGNFQGYHVYRAADSSSPFERITRNGPETDLAFEDSQGASGNVYMVRAVTLETTPSGTYFNASQGVFSAPVP